MNKNEVRISFVFFGVVITMLLSSLNQTILSTALPTIVGELNGVQKLPWVMTSFILATTMVMPIYGKIGDLVGRKKLLLYAIAIFLIGSILGGFSKSIDFLIISRVIQGIGGGGLMILSQSMVADVIPPRERGKYQGILGGVFAFSTVLGPLIGGWLTEGPGWRSAFWFNIPLGLLAMLVVSKYVQLPKKKKVNYKIDFLGMFFLAIFALVVVMVSIWGGHKYAWNSKQIIFLVVISLLSWFFIYFVEGKAQDPVMPRMLYRERNFVLSTISGLLISIAMFGALAYMPTYFQYTIDNIDAQQAGMLMMPMMLSMLTVSIIVGRIVTKTGVYKPFPIIGSLVVGVGLYLLSSLNLDTSLVLICCFLAVLGAGLGMTMQILVLVVQNTFSVSIVGTATASNNYFRQIGSTLGASLVGSIFTTKLTNYVFNHLQQNKQNESNFNLSELTPQNIDSYTSEVKQYVIEGYNQSLMPIFLYLIPLTVLSAFILSFLTPKPLAKKHI